MRHIIRSLATVCCAIFVLQAHPAEARRVALVIGNAEYKIGPLANPLNDAAAVAEAFEKQLKFDKVILKTEPPRVCRRLQILRDWSYDESKRRPRGSRPRCVSARCGWCWSTARRTRRNGRRSPRSLPRSAAQRRPCSNWVRQAERDQGKRPGASTDERERIKALEREIRELRQANEILRKASAYFAQAELDRRWKP